ITRIDYADELREMADYAAARVSIRTVADYETFKTKPLHLVRGLTSNTPLYPSYVPFHHAYVAALLGQEEAVVPLVRAAMAPGPGMFKAYVYDWLVRDRMHTAMQAFMEGSSRQDLLAALEETRTLYPESGHRERIILLIESLSRELAAGVPSFVRKRPDERSREEHIRALIYALRDDTSSGWARTGGASEALVEVGRAAIPFLAEALDDFTPTRARSMRSDRVFRLNRRMDVALLLIRLTSGCIFYSSSSTSHCFHSETPEKRASVVANVREWWAASKDVSRVQAIRKQIRLSHRNLTLRKQERRSMLWNLARLEGPDVVVEDVELLRVVWPEETDPRAKARHMFDPRRMILDRFERFWKEESHNWDHGPVYRFGDKRVYKEITRRFMATGRLDPGRWELGSQLGYLAKYGRNWALPILAEVMKQEAFVSEGDVEYGTKTRWPSEVAAEEIQKLTGQDFGYVKDEAPEEKDIALEKAREWCRAEGRETLAKMAKEDHPPVVKPGDLFFSDDQIEACVAAIQGPDADLRRKTVAELGEAWHYRIQRALLAALEREGDPRERLAILRLFWGTRSGYGHWATWHLPAVIRVLEHDEDTAVRVGAAELIRRYGLSGELRGLEPRLAAVRAARRLAQDQGEPVEVRRAAAEALMGHSWSMSELVLLRRLADDPAFRDFAKLHSHLRRMDETLERIRAAKEERRKRR
ncbi:MAG: hypothetical protein ACYTFI_03410, partial [Planctomycetota bacterium]